VEVVKHLFIEWLMYRCPPIQPPTDTRYKATLVFRRPARITLVPEKLSKPVDEKCQRSNVELPPSRYAGLILIIHHQPPLIAGKIPDQRRQPNNAEPSTDGAPQAIDDEYESGTPDGSSE
jgi:hypothetical protein